MTASDKHELPYMGALEAQWIRSPAARGGSPVRADLGPMRLESTSIRVW
jgi:hypothetical protein